MFDSVKTYSDLINANVAFLQGELESSPYHCRQIDEETIPLVKRLVKLNKLGFVTTCGQPSCDIKDKFIEKTWNGGTCGNWWIEIQQKSFLDGIFPKKYKNRLRQFLDTKTNYYYYFLDEKTMESNFNTKNFNLTRQRSNRSKEKLKTTKWDLYTNVNVNFKTIFEEFLDESFSLFITSSEYCKNSVEDLMIEFFSTLDL